MPPSFLIPTIENGHRLNPIWSIFQYGTAGSWECAARHLVEEKPSRKPLQEVFSLGMADE